MQKQESGLRRGVHSQVFTLRQLDWEISSSSKVVGGNRTQKKGMLVGTSC